MNHGEAAAQRLCVYFSPGAGELLDDRELRTLDDDPVRLGGYLIGVHNRLRRIEDHARLVLEQAVGDPNVCNVRCRLYQGSVQLSVECVIPPDQLHPLGEVLHDSLPAVWEQTV